jgi:hypothetical protein
MKHANMAALGRLGRSLVVLLTATFLLGAGVLLFLMTEVPAAGG